MRAGQLPVRVYTAADGLPRDSVSYVEQDSRGFLWVFTGDGLTRFDGYDFVTYTTDDGLPDRRVNDLLETPEGIYWLATSRGLCRFNPRGGRLRDAAEERPADASARPVRTGEPMFVVFNPAGENVTVFNVLWRDGAGVIWCGTERGLFRLNEAGGRVGFEFIDLGSLAGAGDAGAVTAVLTDRGGSLWVATETSGLYRLPPGGRAERYTIADGLPSDQIASLLEDRDGSLWVGARDFEGGLSRLVQGPYDARRVVARVYRKGDGLPSEWIPSLYQTRDGGLWVGTVAGLCSFDPAARAGRPSFRPYPAQNGFCPQEIWGLSEDRDGNLWVASRCNLLKVARNGFVSYGAADGLDNPYVNSIFESREGELLVSATTAARGRVINRFDGERFTAVGPHFPAGIRYYGWGWGQIILEDRAGEWWVPTGVNKLFLFPHVGRLAQLAAVGPKTVYTTREGLPGTETFRLYEDAAGGVWVATTGGSGSGLARWERGTGEFRDLTAEAGVEPRTDFTCFREDARGSLRIGTSGEGLLRYREGRFRHFTTAEGAPPGAVGGHKLLSETAAMIARARIATIGAAWSIARDEGWSMASRHGHVVGVELGRHNRVEG